jgi:hypothetical protein
VLAGALLALLASLLVPSAAGANRHGAGVCRVEAEVTPSRLSAGETATVSGALNCPDAAEASEQTVTIYQHSSGAPGFSAVGTATPEASGVFHFTTEALEANGVLYARAQGAQGGQGARSRPMTVKVAPVVTIGGPPAGAQLSIAGRADAAGARASNTVTFTGTVSPDESGATVVLQREGADIEENWQRIAIAEVGAEGKYAITHTFGVPGSTHVRVVVHPHGLLPGASEPLALEIMRRQNPLLTIGADAQPLTYGQTLTLSGVAAGGSQPLTLLARTDGSPFAPVAGATSEGDGSYAFTGLSPTANTWYKVTDARTRSNSLFVGVKPRITATPSSPSVQSGAAVTFAGTVTPARSGELFELQRQDPDGLGFEVVETGTLAADGSFATEHVLTGAGTQAFRVVLLGGEHMQAASSGLLDVQVTRAAGTSLQPQAPAAALGEG